MPQISTNMFSEKDIEQIIAGGRDLKIIEKQLDSFKSGFPFIDLVAPASPGNGINQLDERKINEYVSLYDGLSKIKRVLKFVPASGAATRMFKNLFEFREDASATHDLNAMLDEEQHKSVKSFFNNLKKFAFFEELKLSLEKDEKFNIDIFDQKNFILLLEYFLSEKGLNYANLPKGLLLFHRYPDKSRTPFEEHLIEGAHYCVDKQHNVYIHYTVSPDHLNRFREMTDLVIDEYQQRFNVRIDVSISIQKSSTDTIAVNLRDEPFRNADGSMLFRPGGHGALIENLNDLQGDIIFIKYIDNVVADKFKEETYTFKKVLGGLLLSLQEKIFEFLKKLNSGKVSDIEIERIVHFARTELNIDIGSAFQNMKTLEKIRFLFEKLNRPIRVCGMVRNIGEPGGGPFLVRNSRGEDSLQIVESLQINMVDPKQKEIFLSSTHFNPVDLACGVRDYKGEKFNLKQFIDPTTGFISQKSKDGRDLKALELPGLWNGAMADWITVFVEVPIVTFNPVKTVSDLLRPEHQ